MKTLVLRAVEACKKAADLRGCTASDLQQFETRQRLLRPACETLDTVNATIETASQNVVLTLPDRGQICLARRTLQPTSNARAQAQPAGMRTSDKTGENRSRHWHTGTAQEATAAQCDGAHVVPFRKLQVVNRQPCRWKDLTAPGLPPDRLTVVVAGLIPGNMLSLRGWKSIVSVNDAPYSDGCIPRLWRERFAKRSDNGDRVFLCQSPEPGHRRASETLTVFIRCGIPAGCKLLGKGD